VFRQGVFLYYYFLYSFTIPKNALKSKALTYMVNNSILIYLKAEVAELADAYGSGPYGSNALGVQLPPSAPVLNFTDDKVCLPPFMARILARKVKKTCPIEVRIL
jgi:hypothetical protein